MASSDSELEQTIETALRHHEAGRLRHAAALYRRALRDEPNNPAVLHLLGVLAHQVGRRDDALLLLRRAVMVRPSDPTFHEDLGNLHYSRGEFDDAIACYREAVQLENHAASHARLGAALAQQGMLAEAVVAYRKAVEAGGLLQTHRPVRIVPNEPLPVPEHVPEFEPTLFDLPPVLESLPPDRARAIAAGGPLPTEEGLDIVTPIPIEPGPIEWPAIEGPVVTSEELTAVATPGIEIDVTSVADDIAPPGEIDATAPLEMDAAAPPKPISEAWPQFIAIPDELREPSIDASALFWPEMPTDPRGEAAPSEPLEPIRADLPARAVASTPRPELQSIVASVVASRVARIEPEPAATAIVPAIGFEPLDEELPTAIMPESDPLVLGRAELEQLGLAPSAGVFQPSASSRIPSLPEPSISASSREFSDRDDDEIAHDLDAEDDELETPAPAPASNGESAAATTEPPVDPPKAAPADVRPAPDPIAGGIEYLKHRKLRRAKARAKRKPSEAAALRRQADTLLRQRKTEQAINLFAQVIKLMPSSAKAHRDLAAAYLRDDRLEEAVTSLNKALELRPRFVEAFASLGDAYHLQGKLDQAIACYRKVLALRPSAARVNSNLLLTLNYHHKFDPKIVFQEHLRWAERHARPAADALRAHTNDPDPKRRLRIGYVSPDFRRHSVNFFVEHVLARHDHQLFELYCYSDALRADDATDRIATYCDGWRDIRGMRDDDVCRIVREDRIDILIDLSGHTGTNRLAVFARKPAPVQVTYLGYPNTTGLSTMDYRITDAWADPAGMTEALHTEQLVRMPANFLCYAPPAEAPDCGHPPCLDSKQVTFGCFNILAKVTPEVMALWARILAAVPKSRLLMKDRVGSFGYAGRRQYVRDIFRYHRVDPDRLELLGKESDFSRHLHAYRRIDIMLDPFPYNGTTTTCEALWMGVPVITLGGATHVSRVGVSLLANLDLMDFITASGGEYAKAAIALASDPDQLLFLRDTLRDRMRRSTLTDATRFTRNLEAAYRKMWETWCRGKPPAAASSEDTGTILALRDDD